MLPDRVQASASLLYGFVQGAEVIHQEILYLLLQPPQQRQSANAEQ
jgi:hypothetical protein